MQAGREVEERGVQRQDRKEEEEYVLDSSQPPLTLGKTMTRKFWGDSL